MEQAARRFARWVLGIHVVLLAIVISLVFFAARQVYSSARTQAIEQASKRQALLAQQTARGIENYYDSIIENFELLRRSEESEAAQTNAPPEPAPSPRPGSGAPRRSIEVFRGMFAPALWRQLSTRVSHFLIIDRSTLHPLASFPAGEAPQIKQMLEDSGQWLRSIEKGPAISGLVRVGDERVNLVCVPVVAEGRRLFVAVVPIAKIESQFLQRVNDDPNRSAMLLDESARVMGGFDDKLVGKSMIADASDPRLRQIGGKYVRLGQAGTEIIPEPFTVGDHQFHGGMVSIQPIDVGGGKHWYLAIGSTFDEVESVVGTTFRDAVWWAVFVVVSMTAILVSTSIQMIRSRVRMDRIRHQVLTRELSQARQIQLAWLPRNADDPQHIDLEAVNRPASHISGDFYNWFDLPDGRSCVVIGDVTGHGMSAAFLMATTQLLVRMIMPRVQDVGRCMEEVNRQLCQQVFAGQFVTMQILVLDRANARIEIASAGHPPPLLGGGEAFRPLQVESQLVLGVERDIEYPTQSFDLPDGASVVLYTDGVIEAQAPSGNRFEIAGLSKCIYGRFSNAQALSECVLAAVDAFRGDCELSDDLTLVAIQLEPVAQQRESLAEAI